MTMPRSSRSLVVDGHDYRWCVSRGAILVERVGARGLIRETLWARGAIGPGRIAALIRHALGTGWSPDDARPFELPVAEHPFAQPKPHDDPGWRRALTHCLAKFEDTIGTPVVLDHYWWECGLGARLSWGPSDVLPEAERWEGALGLSIDPGDPPICSVSGFPYQGRRLMRAEDEVEFSFVMRPLDYDACFRVLGWTYWEGPGEWDSMKELDDENEDDGDSPMATAQGSVLTLTPHLDTTPCPARVGISLHSVCDDEGTVLLDGFGSPWIRPPTVFVEGGPTLTVDVAQLGRPDQWRPGRYRVSVRLFGLPFGSGEESYTSGPVTITIES